jgi:hypothetical protein
MNTVEVLACLPKSAGATRFIRYPTSPVIEAIGVVTLGNFDERAIGARVIPIARELALRCARSRG